MLFNFDNKTPTESLIEKSDSILNVFRNTANELISINLEIQEENKLLEEERQEIESKQKRLNDAKNQNEKVATKIKLFLEE